MTTARNGRRFIDADIHIFEQLDMWERVHALLAEYA